MPDLLTSALEKVILVGVDMLSDEDRAHFYSLVHEDDLDIADAYRATQRPTIQTFRKHLRIQKYWLWERLAELKEADSLLTRLERCLDENNDLWARVHFLDLVAALDTPDVVKLVRSDPRLGKYARDLETSS